MSTGPLGISRPLGSANIELATFVKQGTEIDKTKLRRSLETIIQKRVDVFTEPSEATLYFSGESDPDFFVVSISDTDSLTYEQVKQMLREMGNASGYGFKKGKTHVGSTGTRGVFKAPRPLIVESVNLTFHPDDPDTFFTEVGIESHLRNNLRGDHEVTVWEGMTYSGESITVLTKLDDVSYAYLERVRSEVEDSIGASINDRDSEVDVT